MAKDPDIKGPITYGDALKIDTVQPIIEHSDDLVLTERQVRVNSAMWIDSYSWVSVISSNVDSIAYNLKERDLYVRFKGGSTYCYRQVPEQVAKDMFNCSSMGRFVHQRLKGEYGFRRVYGREVGGPGLGIRLSSLPRQYRASIDDHVNVDVKLPGQK